MRKGKIFGLGMGGCLFVGILLVLFVVGCFKGCGSDKKLTVPYTTEAGVQRDTTVTIEQVGLFNQSKMNPNVEYRIVWGNVIIGAIGFETIILPIKHFGFTLWEPVGLRTGTSIPGTNVESDTKNEIDGEKQKGKEVLKTSLSTDSAKPASNHL